MSVVLWEAVLEILGGTFAVSAMPFGSVALSVDTKKNPRSSRASSSHHGSV